MNVASICTGELAQRHAPAVLFDLHEHSATGRLLLVREDGRITVDFDDGDIVSSTSTDSDARFGEFLSTSGIINEEEREQAVARATRDGAKVGEALVMMGLLTLDELVDELVHQLRYKLTRALNWTHGTWKFEPTSAEFAVEGTRLRTSDVVLTGLRDTLSGDLAQLSWLDNRSIVWTPRGERLRDDMRKVFGGPLVDSIGARGHIGEIEREVGDALTARAVVEAWVASDLAALAAPNQL